MCTSSTWWQILCNFIVLMRLCVSLCVHRLYTIFQQKLVLEIYTGMIAREWFQITCSIYVSRHKGTSLHTTKSVLNWDRKVIGSTAWVIFRGNTSNHSFGLVLLLWCHHTLTQALGLHHARLSQLEYCPWPLPFQLLALVQCLWSLSQSISYYLHSLKR